MREAKDRLETERFSQPISPFRGSGAHPACNMDRNHEEAGKASNSCFSAELVGFGKYFSRVDDCGNQGRMNRRRKDWRCDPTVRPRKRPPRANFFSRVDRCESQFAQRKLQSTACYPTRRALLSSLECNVHVVELGVFSERMSLRSSCRTRH